MPHPVLYDSHVLSPIPEDAIVRNNKHVQWDEYLHRYEQFKYVDVPHNVDYYDSICINGNSIQNKKTSLSVPHSVHYHDSICINGNSIQNKDTSLSVPHNGDYYDNICINGNSIHNKNTSLSDSSEFFMLMNQEVIGNQIHSAKIRVSNENMAKNMSKIISESDDHSLEKDSQNLLSQRIFVNVNPYSTSYFLTESDNYSRNIIPYPDFDSSSLHTDGQILLPLKGNLDPNAEFRSTVYRPLKL